MLKWEEITIYFIMKLPKTDWGVDCIWIIVDRLSKSSHFIPISVSISTEKLADIYVREVVARQFHEELGTLFHFYTTYHP